MQICKENFHLVIKLAIPDENMLGIIKIVKLMKDSSVLLKCVSKTVENETKKNTEVNGFRC